MVQTQGRARRSLRAQLGFYTASILIPALIGMSLLVLVNVNAGRRSHEQELLARARAVSAAVDKRLTRAIALNEAVATADPLLRGDWPAAEARAARLSGLGGWMLLTDEQGRRIFNTNPQARPQPPAFPLPANIQLALSTGRSQVSNIFFGPGTQRYLVGVDTPVTVNGKRYTLSYVMPPEQFLTDFAAAQAPTGALFTMVDRTHHVVARSRLNSRYAGAPATEDMKRALLANPEGVVRSKSLEGNASVAAFTRSSLSGWSTMVVIPKSTFEAPLWNTLFGVGAVIALASLGAAVCAHLLFRTIARELQRLEQDAVAVGHGLKVAARPGLISNFAEVQSALSEASRELEVRGERQRLMINELNHRVKNTLATVQSLAVQTFRNGDQDARVKFDQRLGALAHAHDLLTKGNWEQVELAEIVARCVRVHEHQVFVEGPSLTLQPHAALALCMCLHELMTNSVKYGALSTAAGNVHIAWTPCPDSDRLRLSWRETGGPRVTAPEKAGFGSRLIDRLMQHELAGRAERRFAPEGMEFIANMGLTATSRWRNDFEPHV